MFTCCRVAVQPGRSFHFLQCLITVRTAGTSARYMADIASEKSPPDFIFIVEWNGQQKSPIDIV